LFWIKWIEEFYQSLSMLGFRKKRDAAQAAENSHWSEENSSVAKIFGV